MIKEKYPEDGKEASFMLPSYQSDLIKINYLLEVSLTNKGFGVSKNNAPAILLLNILPSQITDKKNMQ